jgi:hypothetical protein
MNQQPPITAYLWDKSGPPDPLVANLESVLSSQRHDGRREPELVIGPNPELRVREAPVFRAPAAAPSSPWLSLAAMVALAVIVGWIARPGLGPWMKVHSQGALIGSREAGDRLHVGQWLQTDEASSAEIAVAAIGTVTVQPNSKIRIRGTREDKHILDMRYGSIHAFITAPPRVFIVETPAARAVDMGCEYTLDLDKNGSGILRVTLGHVLLEGPGGITSDVPMLGGTCRIRRDFGPGTPYFDDASTLLIDALERFDFAGQGSADLNIVLEQARPRDALSLWHLLSRTHGVYRESVLARLAQLKPLPKSVSPAAILALDPDALKAWFEAMRPF